MRLLLLLLLLPPHLQPDSAHQAPLQQLQLQLAQLGLLLQAAGGLVEQQQLEATIVRPASGRYSDSNPASEPGMPSQSTHSVAAEPPPPQAPPGTHQASSCPSASTAAGQPASDRSSAMATPRTVGGRGPLPRCSLGGSAHRAASRGRRAGAAAASRAAAAVQSAASALQEACSRITRVSRAYPMPWKAGRTRSDSNLAMALRAHSRDELYRYPRAARIPAGLRGMPQMRHRAAVGLANGPSFQPKSGCRVGLQGSQF